MIGSEINEFLDCAELSLSASIEDRTLTVVINLIGVAPVLNQEVNELVLALSGSIVESRLVESVSLGRTHSHFLQNSPHLYRCCIIRD